VAREARLRRLLGEVLAQVPAATRARSDWCRAAEREASARRFNVVHLIYREKEWDGLAKDYEFGAQTMRDHWASGLTDLRATLAHHDWLALPTGAAASITHDVHREGVSPPPVRGGGRRR
jgi:NTE family protein